MRSAMALKEWPRLAISSFDFLGAGERAARSPWPKRSTTAVRRRRGEAMRAATSQ